MQIDDFLAGHGLLRSDIVQTVAREIGMGPKETLCVSGSLAAGLGNLRSDLDLFLFTTRDLRHYRRGSIVPLRCGPVVADLDWVSPHRWKRALGALADADGDLRNGLRISKADLDFLHRIHIAEPLNNVADLDHLRSDLAASTLCRVLRNRAITGVEALQIDLLGAAEAADALALTVLTPRLAGHLADLMIADAGVTNPGEKWRWHHLFDVAGQSWATAEIFALAFGPVAPLNQSLACAAAAVALANQLIPMVQLGPASQRFLPTRTLRAVGAPGSLPPLRLDSAVRYDGDNYRIFKLCGSAELTCNAQMAAAITVFDGRTSCEEAVERFSCWFGLSAPAAAGLLENLLAVLDSYGFVVKLP